MLLRVPSTRPCQRTTHMIACWRPTVAHYSYVIVATGVVYVNRCVAFEPAFVDAPTTRAKTCQHEHAMGSARWRRTSTHAHSKRRIYCTFLLLGTPCVSGPNRMCPKAMGPRVTSYRHAPLKTHRNPPFRDI